MNNTYNPTDAYRYSRTSDGCDEVWVIYQIATGRILASIAFWDDDQTEADAQMIVAALNTYTATAAVKPQEVESNAG